jgi:hypothetical protein
MVMGKNHQVPLMMVTAAAAATASAGTSTNSLSRKLMKGQQTKTNVPKNGFIQLKTTQNSSKRLKNGSGQQQRSLWHSIKRLRG